MTTTRRRAIVGGSVADPKRYPYYVILQYDGVIGCGGTLVWADLILTAAHCAYSDGGTRGIIAVIGSGGSGNVETRKILRVVPHPAFDDDTNKYDVALFQIDPVAEASLVQLAKPDEFVLKPSDEVTVIGFGATRDDGDNSEVLREVELQVVDDTECSYQYGNDGNIHFPSMICAADIGKEGPCYRDSGGPLLVLGGEITESNVTQPDLQVGVVSFGGSKCGNPEQASVYADVVHVQPWVEGMICRYSVAAPPNCDDSDFATNDYTTSDALSSRTERWLALSILLLALR